MSEREKDMVAGLSKLPKELQDKFADQIAGAAMALDMLAGEDNEKKEDT